MILVALVHSATLDLLEPLSVALFSSIVSVIMCSVNVLGV